MLRADFDKMLENASDEKLGLFLALSILEYDRRDGDLTELIQSDVDWEKIRQKMLKIGKPCEDMEKAAEIIRRKYIPLQKQYRGDVA